MNKQELCRQYGTGRAYETYIGYAGMIQPNETVRFDWTCHYLFAVTGFAMVSPSAAELHSLAVRNHSLKDLRLPLPSKAFRETICHVCCKAKPLEWFLSFGIRFHQTPGIAIHAGMMIESAVKNVCPEEQNIVVLLRGVTVE